MKSKIILCFLVFLSLRANSQQKNNISFLYSFSATDGDNHGVKGDYGYNNKTGMSYGIIYSRNLGGKLSLETGVMFYDDKVEEQYSVSGRGGIADGDVKLISIPILAKWTFKYLFIETGVSIDKQINYSSNSIMNSQSGLGDEFGFGGKYTLGHVSIFVNPYFHVFSILNFSQNGNNNLLEAGLKFGGAYSF